ARFLIAVTVVLAVCQLIGAVMGRIGQPPVVGEVIGGIALGPSALGAVWPPAREWLFTSAVVSAIGMVAQLGLAVFMFLPGSELHANSVGHRNRVVGFVVAGGIGLPFVGGTTLAAVAGGSLRDSAPTTATVLFVGLALAITAMPVLARMLLDL